MSRAASPIINARLVDPASGYDGPGALVVTEGVIADVTHDKKNKDRMPVDFRLSGYQRHGPGG